MNLTDEELIVLIAVLGNQTNNTINGAIEYFDDGIYYTKGDKYQAPFIDGMKTPADNVYNRLLDESNKRHILKWAEHEWI